MPAANESWFISCSLGGDHPCQHWGCLHILADPTSGKQMESGSSDELPWKRILLFHQTRFFNSHLQRTVPCIVGKLAPWIKSALTGRSQGLSAANFYMQAHPWMKLQESKQEPGPRSLHFNRSPSTYSPWEFWHKWCLSHAWEKLMEPNLLHHQKCQKAQRDQTKHVSRNLKTFYYWISGNL